MLFKILKYATRKGDNFRLGELQAWVMVLIYRFFELKTRKSILSENGRAD